MFSSITTNPIRRNQAGFTLLELLVVIAIIAALGGAALVAYDGLEGKAGNGQATFNMAALDKAVRTFKVVSGGHPDEMDSLLVATTTGTDTLTAVFTATTGTPISFVNDEIDEKLGPVALTQAGVDALNEAGITSARYIGSTLSDSKGIVGNAAPGAIPNRAFDNTGRGRGIAHTLAAGDFVAAVASGAGLNGITSFDGVLPSDSSRLRDITGLDETLVHLVVAFGIGNNSTLVSDQTGGNSANLSEAPFYTNVNKNEYGRFIALYHLATDTDGDGVFQDAEHFSEAKFVGIIDPKGDWLDEEYAETTGQKQ